MTAEQIPDLALAIGILAAGVIGIGPGSGLRISQTGAGRVAPVPACARVMASSKSSVARLHVRPRRWIDGALGVFFAASLKPARARG